MSSPDRSSVTGESWNEPNDARPKHSRAQPPGVATVLRPPTSHRRIEAFRRHSEVELAAPKSDKLCCCDSTILHFATEWDTALCAQRCVSRVCSRASLVRFSAVDAALAQYADHHRRLRRRGAVRRRTA
eukprot:6179030-Pleurochrysis_carterae.AAC.5